MKKDNKILELNNNNKFLINKIIKKKMIGEYYLCMYIRSIIIVCLIIIKKMKTFLKYFISSN